MIPPFTVEPFPTRIVFGRGALRSVPDEVARAGLRRVLVLSTPGHAGRAGELAAALGPASAGTHPHAAMHVPVEVAERARAVARQAGANGCVAIGGGSTIGLAKALALSDGLPYIAVPTTYAGSELTPIWGLTERGEKRTGRDPRVRPLTVVYDPDLTVTLPTATTVTSGMNALAHAVEALYAPDGSPLVTLLAVEGIRALAASLPAVVAAPTDIAARERALYGAWLCGTCLGSTTMGLHHKLCHTLGGTFGLPHAETHTVVLPHALAYNAAAAPAAMRALGEALGTADAAGTLWELGRALGAPGSLRELGLTAADIDRAVELATAAPYPNPAPVTAAGVRSLLTAALEGAPPLHCREGVPGAR